VTSLRIGTRGSPLALWQSERIRESLILGGSPAELVRIETAGDLDRDTPLGRFGRPAIFSRELDEALLDRRIDLAVHSLKDLPTELPEGIVLAAVGPREDVRDALVGRGPLRWADLPREATIATSSLRRQAQILRARPDLRVADLRGNVGTRLDQLDATPDWTAVLLAAAGLVRLGLADRIGERLPLELMLPAPGQAALAVTARADDAASTLARAAVNVTTVELAVVAERALLHILEGGCHVPVAAFATFEPEAPELLLRARVLSLDGRQSVEGSMRDRVEDSARAASLGERLARRLIDEGARRILHSAGERAPGNRG
jgi:hydroxymethylbilane synthase